MSNYPKIARELGDHYLDAVERSQQSALKYFAAMRQFAVPVSGRKSSLTIDHASLRDLTDAGFSFYEKLLDQQRNFSRRLLAVQEKPKQTKSAPAKAAADAPAEKEPAEAVSGEA